MDFDKDIRRMYRRQNYVAKISLLLLFVFCIVGFLLGIVFIYINLNHRLTHVERVLFQGKSDALVEGEGGGSEGFSLPDSTGTPVTMATTAGLSQEESMIHDLKKQGHSIKAKLEEIDKKILDLNPRVGQEQKRTGKRPDEPSKMTQGLTATKDSNNMREAKKAKQKKKIKILQKTEQKTKPGFLVKNTKKKALNKKPKN